MGPLRCGNDGASSRHTVVVGPERNSLAGAPCRPLDDPPEVLVRALAARLMREAMVGQGRVCVWRYDRVAGMVDS